MSLEGYALRAYALVGRFVEDYAAYFKYLKNDLKRANLKITLASYVSAAILCALLTFAFSFPLLLLASLTMAELNYLTILALLSASLATAALAFVLFILYAKFRAIERERDIDANLPYAVNHMATIAASGVAPIAIFRSLARFEQYGEISKVAKQIVRNSDTFGYDITQAVVMEASRIPSKSFREVLIGINSTVLSGGDLTAFLNEAARDTVTEHRQKIKSITDRLGMYSEVYVTLFVAAPVFFIVMGSIMGMVGGGTVDPLTLIKIGVYLGIPAANIAYLLFIEASVPVVE